MIFPELKNINIFKKLSLDKKEILKNIDFIFLLSLMIIDKTDNVDYFLYRFNLSKKDQKRIKIINNFFKETISHKTFTESSMNNIFFYEGKQAVIDILNFRIIKLKKIDPNLIELKNLFHKKELPVMPVRAETLMKKYNIPEGKQLGEKLKIIEKEWVKNNFEIIEKKLKNIINN